MSEVITVKDKTGIRFTPYAPLSKLIKKTGMIMQP